MEEFDENQYGNTGRGASQPDALEQIFQGPLNWVNLVLIAVNILVFIGLEIMGSTEDTAFMVKWGASYTPLILDGEWYRLFTSMFLHFGVSHLVNNMVIQLFVGDMLEGWVGHVKYLIIYIGGGLLGNLLSMYMDLRTGDMIVSAGASGAIFAVIGGVIYVLFRMRVRGRSSEITLRRILFVVALTIYHGFQSTGVDNMAHIGGLLGGFLLTLLLFHPKNNRRNRAA